MINRAGIRHGSAGADVGGIAVLVGVFTSVGRLVDLGVGGIGVLAPVLIGVGVLVDDGVGSTVGGPALGASGVLGVIVNERVSVTSKLSGGLRSGNSGGTILNYILPLFSTDLSVRSFSCEVVRSRFGSLNSWVR